MEAALDTEVGLAAAESAAMLLRSNYTEGTLPWRHLTRQLAQDAHVADNLYEQWPEKRPLLKGFLSFDRFAELMGVRTPSDLGVALPLRIAAREPARVAQLLLTSYITPKLNRVALQGLCLIEDVESKLRERLNSESVRALEESTKTLVYKNWPDAFKTPPARQWIHNLDKYAREKLFCLFFEQRSVECLEADFNYTPILEELLPNIELWTAPEALRFSLHLFLLHGRRLPSNFNAVMDNLQPKFADMNNYRQEPLATLVQQIPQFMEHLHRWLPVDVACPWPDSPVGPFVLASNYRRSGHPPALLQKAGKMQKRRQKRRTTKGMEHLAIYPWMSVELLPNVACMPSEEASEAFLCRHLQHMLEIGKAQQAKLERLRYAPSDVSSDAEGDCVNRIGEEDEGGCDKGGCDEEGAEEMKGAEMNGDEEGAEEGAEEMKYKKNRCDKEDAEEMKIWDDGAEEMTGDEEEYDEEGAEDEATRPSTDDASFNRQQTAWLTYYHLHQRTHPSNSRRAPASISKHVNHTANQWILNQPVEDWVRKFPTPQVAHLLQQLSRFRPGLTNLLQASFWPSMANRALAFNDEQLAATDIDCPLTLTGECDTKFQIHHAGTDGDVDTDSGDGDDKDKHTRKLFVLRDPQQLNDAWINTLIHYTIYIDTLWLQQLLDNDQFRQRFSHVYHDLYTSKGEHPSQIYDVLWRLDPPPTRNGDDHDEHTFLRQWRAIANDEQKLALSAWLPTRHDDTIAYFAQATQVHHVEGRIHACECLAAGAARGDEKDRTRAAKLIARRISRLNNNHAHRLLRCIARLSTWNADIDNLLAEDLKLRSDPEAIYLCLANAPIPADSKLWRLWSARELLAPPGPLTGLSLQLSKLYTGEKPRWPEGNVACAFIDSRCVRTSAPHVVVEDGILTNTASKCFAPVHHIPESLLAKAQLYFDHLSPRQRAKAYPNLLGLVKFDFSIQGMHLHTWDRSRHVCSLFPLAEFSEYATFAPFAINATLDELKQGEARAQNYIENLSHANPLTRHLGDILGLYAHKPWNWSKLESVWQFQGSIDILKRAQTHLCTWRTSKSGRRVREEVWPPLLVRLMYSLLSKNYDKRTIQMGHRVLRLLSWPERQPVLQQLAEQNPELMFTSMFRRLPFESPLESKRIAGRYFLPLQPSIHFLIQLVGTPAKNLAIQKLRGKVTSEQVQQLMQRHPDSVKELATLYTELAHVLTNDFLSSSLANELNQILEAMPASRANATAVLNALLRIHAEEESSKVSAQKAMMRFLCRSDISIAECWRLNLHRDVRSILVEYDAKRGAPWMCQIDVEDELAYAWLNIPECVAPLFNFESSVFASQQLRALCHSRFSVPKSSQLYDVVKRIRGEVGVVLSCVYAVTDAQKWEALTNMEAFDREHPGKVFIRYGVAFLGVSLLPRLLAEEPPRVLTPRYYLLLNVGKAPDMEVVWLTLPERSRQLAVLRCAATFPALVLARQPWMEGAGALRKEVLTLSDLDLNVMPLHAMQHLQRPDAFKKAYIRKPTTESEHIVQFLRDIHGFWKTPDWNVWARNATNDYVKNAIFGSHYKPGVVAADGISQPWTLTWKQLQHLTKYATLDLRDATLEQTVRCLNGLTETLVPIHISSTRQRAVSRMRGLLVIHPEDDWVEPATEHFLEALRCGAKPTTTKYLGDHVNVRDLVVAFPMAWIGVENLPDEFAYLSCMTCSGKLTPVQQVSLFRAGLLDVDLAKSQERLATDVYRSGQYELTVAQAQLSGDDSWAYVCADDLQEYLNSRTDAVKLMPLMALLRLVNYRVICISYRLEKSKEWALCLARRLRRQELTPTGRCNVLKLLERYTSDVETMALCVELAGDLPFVLPLNIYGRDAMVRTFASLSRDCQAAALWGNMSLAAEVEVPDDLDMCVHGGLVSYGYLTPARDEHACVTEGLF